MSDISNYTIDLHRHRFAAWAASTAARASPKCRFAVHVGVQIIEESEASRKCASWRSIPVASEFDGWHAGQCQRMVDHVSKNKLVGANASFSYGVAAKLLNCYMKTLFLGSEDDSSALSGLRNCMHPPIDRLLLDQLARKDVGGRKRFWNQYKNKGWSVFDQGDYLAVIEAIRDVTSGKLWRIEAFWPVSNS